jgi:adenosine deaminase
MKKFPLRAMMEAGLLVTINSDDPAYFGGYINANYKAIAESLDLNIEDLRQLAKNGFQASFASDQNKKQWTKQVDDYCDTYISTCHIAAS